MITVEGENLRINGTLVDFNLLWNECQRLTTSATIHYAKGIYAILANTHWGVKRNVAYKPIDEEKLLKYLDLLQRTLQTGHIVR